MQWREHEELANKDVASLVRRVRDQVVKALRREGKWWDGDDAAEAEAEAVTSSACCCPWAELLRRVFEVDALVCQHGGGRRRLLAPVTAPESIERVLRSMGLAAEAPELAPPGGDAQWGASAPWRTA